MRVEVIRLLSFLWELFILPSVMELGTGGAFRTMFCRFWLVLLPVVGREPAVDGIFGKARYDENSPLCWAIVLLVVELSGLLAVTDLIELFVLLRMVTLLNDDAGRLWPDAVGFLDSVWSSDKIDLFDGTLRMLTNGTAAFSCAEVTEGFRVTSIWFNFCLSLDTFDTAPRCALDGWVIF